MEPSLPYQGLSVNGPTHAGEGTRTARSNPRTRGAFPRYIKTHHKQRVSPVRDNPLSHLDGFQQRSGFPARSAGKRGPQKPSKGGFYGSVDLEYLENLGIHRLGRKPIHYIGEKRTGLFRLLIRRDPLCFGVPGGRRPPLSRIPQDLPWLELPPWRYLLIVFRYHLPAAPLAVHFG